MRSPRKADLPMFWNAVGLALAGAGVRIVRCRPMSVSSIAPAHDVAGFSIFIMMIAGAGRILFSASIRPLTDQTMRAARWIQPNCSVAVGTFLATLTAFVSVTVILLSPRSGSVLDRHHHGWDGRSA